MAKYIDADVYKNILYDYGKSLAIKQEQADIAVLHCLDLLEVTPTADVEPVKRGKWINIPLDVSNDKYGMNKYNLRIKCSFCGFVTAAEFRYMTHCHCCGAKMEGDAE